MSVIKTKLRNKLAILMVKSVFRVWYSLQERNETCVTMAILSEMVIQLNMSMYDHKCNQLSTLSAAREQKDKEDKSKEFINLLQDIEEFLSEPIFLNSWFSSSYVRRLIHWLMSEMMMTIVIYSESMIAKKISLFLCLIFIKIQLSSMIIIFFF